MALRTYYEILGVSYDAVEGEIRRGYRRAVQEHHPDQNPSSEKSQKRIRELNAARETLLNSALREKYDAKLRRGGLIPPENSADPGPAKAKDQADSDELDFPESDRSVDAESVAEGFASQSFEPELESTTADWNTSAWNTNRHKYSGKKRKQRFQLLISLVMIPTGGIAGIAVAVLLLWVGFRLDPLGLFQVDGTQVASKSVVPIPSTNPLSRGSSAANTFGDPLNLNQTQPAEKKTENKNTGAPSEEEIENFLESLDKNKPKKSPDTQGSDSQNIEPKPKEPTEPVKTVNVSLLDRFAALPKLPRGWKIEESRSVTIDKYGQGVAVELPVPELANTTTYSVTVDLQLDGRITGRPRFHIFLPTGNGGQVLLDFEFIKTMWSFRAYSRTPEKSTLEGVRSYRPAFGTRQIKMQIAPDETRVWLGAEIVALFKTPGPASSPSNAKPTVSLDCIPGSVMKFRVRRFDIELEQNVKQTNTVAPSEEEMQNFLDNLDKNNQKKSPDTQGSDSPNIEPKPESPRDRTNVQLVDIISPFSKSARTGKIQVPAGTTKIEIGIIRGGWTHKNPAMKHVGKLGVLSVNDRVVNKWIRSYTDGNGTTHNLFQAFDGTQPNTRLGETMQGVFDITEFAKPGDELVIAYRHQLSSPKLGVRVRFHSRTEPPPATNSFGMSFAKLEFSEPPQLGKLATGTAIHCDRDSVWAKIPVELDGLQATQWKVHHGRADFSVTSPGYVVMATSSRWGGGGRKDGIWDKELTTEQDLLNDGWLRYTTIEEVTKDPKYARWPVFIKQFEAGEKLQIRTEKYLAPRFFFPLAVTQRESPTELDLTTQPKIATSAPNSDLTIIEGITERTQTALNAANIKTIDQIATLTASDISLALIKGGYYPVDTIQDYQSWILQSKTIIGDSSPSKKTFAPIPNNGNNPMRESVVKLNQLTDECKQFDWIPKTEAEFKTLQSLITSYTEIKKQAKKDSSTETGKQVTRQLTQLETSLNQRALLFSDDDQSALKQMNRSFAESALQKPNQPLPIYGEFIQIQIASNQILVRLVGTSTYIRASYVPTDEPMRPESKWLFFIKTVEAPKTIGLKLSGGETVPTETVNEFYKFGQ